MKALQTMFQRYSQQVAVLGGLVLASMVFVGCQTSSVPSSGRSIDDLKTAANKGEAGAAIELGDAYFYGKGVPQNYAEAERWYKKASSSN